MSISTLFPPNFFDLKCDKVYSEIFSATSILNTTPTIEFYGSNGKDTKQKLVSGSGVSYSGKTLISDRNNLINSTTVNVELKIPASADNTGLIVMRFGWWMGGDTGKIGYIYNENPMWKYVPRSLEETVSVNLQLPWYNISDAPTIVGGTTYRMFISIYNFTGESVYAKVANSIPVKIKVIQF
jgi:hypothetical protein